MTLIVDRTTAQQPTGTEQTLADDTDPGRRIDVSELDLEGIEEYVDSSIETDHVSLEQRGSRTYLRLET